MKTKIINNDLELIYMIDDKPQMIIPKNKELIKHLGEVSFVEDIDLLRKKNINVLNIGLGAGYTLEKILKYDFVKKVDTVEIFQEVIDNLKNFDTYENIITDNRNQIICDDALKYVSNCDCKYDVVVMDICQPEFEYCGRLFTKEFFEQVNEILLNDGIFLIWFYRKGTRGILIKNIVESLKKHFKYVDFIENVNSKHNDTHFFASNTYKIKNNKSLISKI